MNSIWFPLLLTLGFWAVAAAALLFLSRSIRLVKILLPHAFILLGLAGLLFLSPRAAVSLPEGWNAVLLLALIVVAIWAVLRTLGFFFFSRLQGEREEAVVPPLLRHLIMGVVYALAFFVVLKIFYPELSLTGVVIGSTVFSAIVGLALQDMLGNFFAGIALAVEKPLRIGDWVLVGGKEGLVTEITWRSTRLRMRDNNLLVIPNSALSKEVVLNFNEPSRLHRKSIRVGVAYAHSPRVVIPALEEAARRVEPVLENPPPQALIADFADFSVVYELRYWLPDYEKVPDVASAVRGEVYDVLKRAGLKIPFPVREVHLRTERAAAAPAPRLIAFAGPSAGKSVELAGELSLGREEGNTVVIAEPSVSKRHARLLSAEDGVYIEDLGSKSGTILNGSPIQRQKLQPGDEIRIGSAVFLFEV